jgi:hypothetical protein
VGGSAGSAAPIRSINNIQCGEIMYTDT